MTSENKKTVLVVDDHPLVARATKTLLEKIEYVEVVGLADNAKQCLELVLKLQPDLVFLDYHLPDETGSKVTEQIKEKFPNMHVVIFSGINITDMTNHFLDMKVSAILPKESSEWIILNTVKCVLEGFTIVPLPLFHQLRMSERQNSIKKLLTEDEITIMELMVNGATQDRIAEHIHVSKRSVDNYLKKIYKKLGVGNRVQAIQVFVLSEKESQLERMEGG